MVQVAITRPKPLNPWRKAPRQARAEATVDAICQATVQLLLRNGAAQLTTTRVAERAGVSVGTMYQYFPHKRALLRAMFERHIQTIAQSIELACERSRAQPLDDIAANLIAAFLEVIQSRPDESRAAYSLLAEPENAGWADVLFERTTVAVGRALATSVNATFDNTVDVAVAVTNALAGSARWLIERGLPPDVVRAQREQLTLMVSGYLRSAGQA
ncbi:TetR/AcrR family transcriptional regulator [Sphingomonas bacterium]|uniref:TetR/AcrR family transcriptional regulator n=1 Tax=Sphingomonas bacterium TaxID=1895847 RepID=UPI00157567C2|nr:TetR/AcrR family transcriptional regulator [Sphingomonas bacterium]